MSAGAAVVGLLADRVLGEPRLRPHPLSAFGSTMGALEHRLYRDHRLAGTVHAVAGVALGTAAGAVVGSAALATYVAVAGRELAAAALRVHDALGRGHLDDARRLLPALVGRDPAGLDEAEAARAVVESVAENTVDAVVAPVLWATWAGAPGALAYRAVNTLDAMVGHRSPRYRRYGWASARLDDAAGWLPARVTAALVAAVRPRAAAGVWRAVAQQAPAHPSPNAGVAEAAFAAALGLRLGGENRYPEPAGSGGRAEPAGSGGRDEPAGSGGRAEPGAVRVERRPPLGDGRTPEVSDIVAAVRLSGDVGAALGAALATVAAAGRRRRPVTRP